LTSPLFSFGADAVGPRYPFRSLEAGWPASNMDFDSLRVFVITKKRLKMLPAVTVRIPAFSFIILRVGYSKPCE